VYEVSPEGGPRSLFEKVHAYLIGPLAREVSGAAAVTLTDTQVALREVLKSTPREREKTYVFLHNYEKTIWDQILVQLPHRFVSRVSIISRSSNPTTRNRKTHGSNLETRVSSRACSPT
jgi:hypothetical protein